MHIITLATNDIAVMLYSVVNVNTQRDCKYQRNKRVLYINYLIIKSGADQLHYICIKLIEFRSSGTDSSCFYHRL